MARDDTSEKALHNVFSKVLLEEFNRDSVCSSSRTRFARSKADVSASSTLSRVFEVPPSRISLTKLEIFPLSNLPRILTRRESNDSLSCMDNKTLVSC